MEPGRSDPEPLRELFLRLGLEPPPQLSPEEAAAAAAQRRARYVEEHEAEERKLPEHLTECGVGERTMRVIAEGPGDTRPMAEVTLWAASGEAFCLLLGGPGSGKTVAAASALQLARIRWREDDAVRWRFSAALGLFTTAAALAKSVHGDGELVARARRVAVLVLDDLGAEYADQGERWVAELTGVIDARHEGFRRTVITSNLSAAQFKARYGERIASRIRGAGRVVPCGAIDLRGQR